MPGGSSATASEAVGRPSRSRPCFLPLVYLSYQPSRRQLQCISSRDRRSRCRARRRRVVLLSEGAQGGARDHGGVPGERLSHAIVEFRPSGSKLGGGPAVVGRVVWDGE